MNGNVIELKETDFGQEVLGAANPVLVHFWAGWSEPSVKMAPVLESVARNDEVPVKVVRINLDQNQALADTYGVRAVPTLLIFNQGKLRDEIIGRASEREVRRKLSPFR